MKSCTYLLITILCNVLNYISCQSTNINLDNGKIAGIKVFPETSKSPVYVFLGIPYAEAPVGNLRFSVRFVVHIK